MCSNNNIKVPKFKTSGFKTTKERSQLMSRIKSKDTKPELRFRKKLWGLGYRYRLNVAALPGKPDIVLNKYKVVVFIDGEFWHGYNWQEKKKKIKSNRDFWIPKIERNMQRDNQNNVALNALGYKVFRFWEKDVNKKLEESVNAVLSHIESLQCRQK